MSHIHSLATTDIQAIFAEEIAALGGTVSDTFDDGGRLFTRAVLPGVREVRPKDRVQGGVALRTVGEDVCVHPYLFRQICTNGAIRAHAIQTRQITGLDLLPANEADAAIREAIRACGTGDAFTMGAEEMRSALEKEADLVLTLMPFLSQMPRRVPSQMLSNILDRFRGEADRSRFGLMNAVTSMARDTEDPELRWRLEEFGGGIPVATTPTLVSDPGAAKALEREIEERRPVLAGARA